MNRRIETRVVDTGNAALTTLVQKDACEVWWISYTLKDMQSQGMIQLFDGFDVNGKLQWQLEPSVGMTSNFIPPIPCDYGLTVYNNANIASYTVAYRGKGWPKEPT